MRAAGAAGEPVVIAVALGQTLALGVLLVAWIAVVLRPAPGRWFAGRAPAEQGRRLPATEGAASGANGGGGP